MLTILLPWLAGLTFLGFTVVENTMSLSLRTSSPIAECPRCQTPSRRIQSRYFRILADLPLTSFCLRLNIQARRFVCSNPECSQKIFVVRLTDFAKVYAHRTLRQAEELYQFGWNLGVRREHDWLRNANCLSVELPF